MNAARTTSGSRRVVRLAALEKAIVGNACARAVACVRALGDGCVTPNPAVKARTEDRGLKIHRRRGPALVFTVSGRLDVENVGELCHVIDEEPAGAVVMLDLTDLVLADRDAVRYLRDYETGGRIMLRNCPAYIRAWMAAE